MLKNSYDISKIGFYGSLLGVGSTMGYGYVAVQLIEAWQRQNVPVWWGDDEAPIAFTYCQPHFYEYELPRINVGYTPWESTVVPKAWIPVINKMTELWTTSTACMNWFENSGVEVPIRVLPHGINSEHWSRKKRALKPGEAFKFLHVGSDIPRKGGQMAYEAFKKLYGNTDGFHLILKGKPYFDVDIDNVTVIEDSLRQQDLLDLYHRCHVMLYPGNGEGFGLIPFQAAATGMPTIATNWGGIRDYSSYINPIRVKDLIDCDYEPHEGQWALPDFDDLCEAMQSEYEYFDDASWWYYNNSARMHAEWSWDSIATTSLTWLKELIESSPG